MPEPPAGCSATNQAGDDYAIMRNQKFRLRGLRFIEAGPEFLPSTLAESVVGKRSARVQERLRIGQPMRTLAFCKRATYGVVSDAATCAGAARLRARCHEPLAAAALYRNTTVTEAAQARKVATRKSKNGCRTSTGTRVAPGSSVSNRSCQLTCVIDHNRLGSKGIHVTFGTQLRSRRFGSP